MSICITKSRIISSALCLLFMLSSSFTLAETPVETESARLLFDDYNTSGLSYDVDVDGDTAIVGGGPPGQEGARIFIRNNGAWTQQAVLTPSDGWNYSFATSVGISGDTAIIGLGGWWSGDKQLPHIYIFVRSNGVWTEQAKLPTPPEATQLMSPTVAIDGDNVIVGFADDNGNSSTAIYHRTGNTWTEQAKYDFHYADSWGIPVTVSNDTAAFLVENTLYVYRYTDGTWTLEDYFPSVRISLSNIALSQDTLAFGMFTLGTYSTVEVYRRTYGSSWTFEASLSPSEDVQSFGHSIDLRGDNIIASTADGTAFHFSRSGNTWSESKKLLPSDPDYQLFGWSVAISDDTMAVGALGAAAYVYNFTATSSDQDNDGILDVSDNCPAVPNPEQDDNDYDGTGDVCDDDDDNDNVPDDYDNCRYNANPDQRDSDRDGSGDVCDEDLDGDLIPNHLDNCPAIPNTAQEDFDYDGLGDVCDPDDDNDGIADLFPDNCPLTPNPDQADLDSDGIGDLCDADMDGDGITNSADNCPVNANPGQDDTDGDGSGDACDEDDDADLVLDVSDNCPLIPNPDQADTDHDGRGDACDSDLDGDGISNNVDNCPSIPNSSQSDMDGDGLGDNCDPDIDGDSVANETDQCPATPIGEIIDPVTGCSLAQLCPCSGPRGSTEAWHNHGKYVSCMTQTAKNFTAQSLLSDSEHGFIVSAAAESECGK